MSDDPKKALKKFEEIAAACNRCGFCTSFCPTYLATGNELHSPRGRNQAFRAVVEGKATIAEVEESIDSCLLCGECTSVCFSEVPTAHLMTLARAYRNTLRPVAPAIDFLLRQLLPYPKRLTWALRGAFLGKRLGIAWLLRKTGVLKRFAPALHAGENLLATAPTKFLLDESVTRPFQERIRAQHGHKAALAQQRARKKNEPVSAAGLSTGAKIAFFPVCGSQYIRPSIGLATFDLLRRLKVDFILPDGFCCGLPAESLGVAERTLAFARQNIEALERGHFESIVIDDSSCAAHMKEYPRLLQQDAMWLKRAHDLSQKVRELSVFLLQRGLKDHLRLARWEGPVVAYHDPCKAQYAQRLVNPPRELLSSIPNLKMVTVPDADQCCGGGGTYSLTHPELSQEVLSAKVRSLVSTGAKVVVTSSASCLLQVAFGLRSVRSDIEVLHLSEFLLRALTQRR